MYIFMAFLPRSEISKEVNWLYFRLFIIFYLYLLFPYAWIHSKRSKRISIVEILELLLSISFTISGYSCTELLTNEQLPYCQCSTAEVLLVRQQICHLSGNCTALLLSFLGVCGKLYCIVIVIVEIRWLFRNSAKELNHNI